MYCTQCGSQLPPAASACSRCGHAAPRFPDTVPSYLVPAVLATVCCCVPFGIPAIVYAAQVNGKLEAGNVAGALDSSRKARGWCWAAFGTGLVLALGYWALALVAAVAGG